MGLYDRDDEDVYESDDGSLADEQEEEEGGPAAAPQSDSDDDGGAWVRCWRTRTAAAAGADAALRAQEMRAVPSGPASGARGGARPPAEDEAYADEDEDEGEDDDDDAALVVQGLQRRQQAGAHARRGARATLAR
jgi:hypothetical protein